MKYKIFTTALMGAALLSGAAQAASCPCPTTSACSTFKKYDPRYYICFMYMTTINGVCTPLLCGANAELDAKLATNEAVCSSGEQESACQDLLDQDIKNAATALQSALTKQQNIELTAAQAEAEACAKGQCD